MKWITIQPGGGRFANQVIMYMAALAIAEKIGGAEICGVGFPQWNIAEIAPPAEAQDTIIINHPDVYNLAVLAAAVKDKPSVNIILNFHAQNIGNLLDLSRYRQIFPVLHRDVPVYDEEHLLIHIRAGDILDGAWAWFPLLPVNFIRDVVTATGKIPVFMGELDDGPYVRQLRAAFPAAVFLPQASLMRDFDMMRQAKNILVGISTFSWLAAWLGEAETIHLPLTGFYNPAHMSHIDLLPVNDARYRFYLFPFYEAVPEVEALKVHEKLSGWWKQISAAQLRGIMTDRPRIKATERIDVDRYWYLGAYPDAGLAISEGKYENAAAHYAHVGRKAGYLPLAPLVIADVPLAANLALRKPATQSSTWEGAAARPPELDAAGAVDGDVTKAQGFHTAIEANPWWMVDLLAPHLLYAVHIYNRSDHYHIRARASPLVLLGSLDQQDWTALLRTAPGELFGAERGPLVWQAAQPFTARYVKIMLNHPRQYLHLAQVAVFGVAVEPRQPGNADGFAQAGDLKLPLREEIN
jgi:hypothetical protein